MLAIVLLLSAVLSSTTVDARACSERTRAAFAYSEDSEPSVRDALTAELARACFTLIEVIGADDRALLDAARVVPAPWLLLARATVVEVRSASTNYALTVDVRALDVASGQRRGRAVRNAKVLARIEQVASSRESVRVMADAVRVLAAQMKGPPPQIVVDRAELSVEPRACADLKYIVLLWHKFNDDSAKAAVLHALEARCVTVLEHIDGDRTLAMESARKLSVPLVVVKTTLFRLDPELNGVSHKIAITVDVVDAQAEGLKILAHASDTHNALRASDDVDAWKKVEGSLLGSVLDKVLTPP